MASVRESAVITSGPAIAAARTPEPVPFGLKDGRLYEPLQVERGLACSCTCPGCGARLVAKHAPSGKVRPHFAHDKESDCATESPRVSRRLNTLRGLSHEEDEQVLARGA